MRKKVLEQLLYMPKVKKKGGGGGYKAEIPEEDQEEITEEITEENEINLDTNQEDQNG